MNTPRLTILPKISSSLSKATLFLLSVWLLIAGSVLIGALSAPQITYAANARSFQFAARLISNTTGYVVPTGDYSVRFALYAQASGGGSLWSETQTLHVSNGLLTALIGSVTPFPDSLDFNSDYFLGVKVGSDDEMTPRQTLASVASALNADRLNGALPGTGANNIVQLDNNGALNIVGNISTKGSLTADSLQANTFNGATINGGSLSATAVNGIATSNLVTQTGTYTDPSWLTSLAAGKVTGILPVTAGGTGLGTISAGDLLYGSASNTLSSLPLGAGGSCLISDGTNALWGSCSGSGSLTDLQAAYVNGNIITTTNARDLKVALANTATDPNFLVNIASGSTGEFAVQSNGVDQLRVTAAGTSINAGGFTVSAGTTNLNAGGLTNAGAVSGVTTLATSGAINGTTLTGGNLSGTDVDGVTIANILQSSGSYANPSWITSLAATKLTGAVAASKGGTGIDTSASTGIPQIAAGTWSVLANGSDGSCLVLTTGAPAWGSCSSGAISGTGTAGQLPYWSGSSTLGSAPHLLWNNGSSALTVTGTADVSGAVTGATFNGATITSGSLSSTVVDGVTVANIIQSSGSYADPAWLTSLAASKITGTVAIANGGTNANTATNARTNLSAAASGANSDITSLAGLTTPLSATQGGTGTATFATGDLLYASASNTLSKLAAGSNGSCLVLSAGVETWNTCSGVGSGNSLQSAYSNGNNITTTNNNDLQVVLADTSTDSNFTVNIASGSTGKFAVQGAGTDILNVTTAGGTSITGNLAVSGTVGGSWVGSAIGSTHGGTGQTSVTQGDLLYGTGSNTWGKLALGGGGSCLTSNGTNAVWGSCAGSGSGVTLQAAYTNGNTITEADATDLAITLPNTATDPNFIINIATGSSSKFAVQSNGSDVFSVTGSATTITSGGLNLSTSGITNAGSIAGVTTIATSGAIDGLNVSSGVISAGTWNGTAVGVQYGGTGVASATSNGLLFGNGTSALQVTAAGTSGQLLVANTSGVPTFVSLSSDATLAATGVLTLSTVNANVGSFGSSTQIPQITIDGKGRITAASTVGVTAAGSAGGDLSGTYPNPTVAKINGVGLGSTTATAANLLIGSGSQWVSQAITGDVTITSGGVTAIGSGKVTPSDLAVGSYSGEITSGTYSINISGNAATVSNGVYTNAANVLIAPSNAAVLLSLQPVASTGTAHTLNIYNNAATPAIVSYFDNNGLFNGSGAGINSATIANASLANSSISTSFGTGASGSGSVSLGGTLTINNTGVTSITGTANQITASASTGGVTLSLPQSIAAASSPSFTGLTLTGTAANALAVSGAPVNSATSSLAQLGGAIAGGNTVANGGTYLGINEPSSGAGSVADLLNLQNNGTAELKLTSAGVLTVQSTINGATLSGGTLSGGSLSATAVNGLTLSGGTVSAGTWQGTAVGAIYGGTAQTSYTTGDILYASASNTLSKLAIGATGQFLGISGGVPTWTSQLVSQVSTLPTAASGNRGTIDLLISGPAYDTTVQAEASLVRYYKLNETSLAGGATITDSKSANNLTVSGNGSLIGSQTGAVGDGSTAIKSGGAVGGYGYTFGASLGNLPLTFESWVKYTATTGSDTSFFRIENTGGSSHISLGFPASSSTLSVYDTSWHALGTVSSGVWHHVVMTITSGGSVVAYVDGTQLGTASVSTFTSIQDLFLFGDPSGTPMNNVYMQKTAVYNAVLNSTQVSAHYVAAGLTNDAAYISEKNAAGTYQMSQVYDSLNGPSLQASYGFGNTIAATNTTGNGVALSSSTVSSGNVLSLASTSTAAASNTLTVLNVAASGANGTTTQTTYGLQVSNVNTGTSNTNIGGYFTASGATNNYALQVASGQLIDQSNGATSAPADLLSGTWFTGGGTTATKPQLLVEPAGTATTAWSNNGTGVGVNAASGFTGNLLDTQLAGVSKFSVASTGAVTSAGNLKVTATTTGANTSSPTVSLEANGWNGAATNQTGDFVLQNIPTNTNAAKLMFSVTGFATANVASLNQAGNWITAGTQTASSTPDIAEYLPADSSVQAYDVVMAAPSKNSENFTATENTIRGNPAVLGVISDGTSAFQINSYGEYIDQTTGASNGTGKPLVLAGRVKVKVTGTIHQGDLLMPSDKAGYAEKFDPTASNVTGIIGVALADSVSGSNTVLAQIQVSRAMTPQMALDQTLDSLHVNTLTVVDSAVFDKSVTINGALNVGVQEITADHTLDDTNNTVLVDATAKAITLTLPSAVSAPGREYVIKKTDVSANGVVITAVQGETIDGQPTYNLPSQYNAVTIVSDGKSWLIINKLSLLPNSEIKQGVS